MLNKTRMKRRREPCFTFQIFLFAFGVGSCINVNHWGPLSTFAHPELKTSSWWGKPRNQLQFDNFGILSPDRFIPRKESTTKSNAYVLSSSDGIENGIFNLIRGGEQPVEGGMTLDQKVHAAMRKLGLSPPEEPETTDLLPSREMIRPPLPPLPRRPPPPPPLNDKLSTTHPVQPLRSESNIICDGDSCSISNEENELIQEESHFSPPVPKATAITTEEGLYEMDPVIDNEQSSALLDLPNATPIEEEGQSLEHVEPSNNIFIEKQEDSSLEFGATGDDSFVVTSESISEIDTIPNATESVLISVEDEGIQEKDDDGFFDKVNNAFQKYNADNENTDTEILSSEIETQVDLDDLANTISKDLNVDLPIAWAALGATSTTDKKTNIRRYDSTAARNIIKLELEMIERISETSEEVQQLVSEGHSVFLSRRALAFAELNMQDARAILLADQQDEQEQKDTEAAEEERLTREIAKKRTEESFKTIDVKANFDPTAIAKESEPPSLLPLSQPKPREEKIVAKDSVVFDATAAQIQELLFESPVPVLLDIYADWCGPCKALSPILEEMAVKSGGAFRLVKVNSDNERAVSGALQVTALPTIFGCRNGKILNSFQGMPKSEEMMKSFLMGLLVSEKSFKPQVTESEKKNYEDLSAKLLKVACSASYPFSSRERLAERVSQKLSDLLEYEADGDVLIAEESARTIRSLLSNLIKRPFDAKFRTVNMANTKISKSITKYPSCVSILKGAGFTMDKDNKMIAGKGKTVVNVAPLIVSRDAIDKWIDKTRHEVAKASRKRNDEIERQKLKLEAENNPIVENLENQEEATVDPNLCTISVRLEGKKKKLELPLDANDTLRTILERIPNLPRTSNTDEDSCYQITCVAKRMVILSTDVEAMQKSLRELKLLPAASLVIATVGSKDGNGKKSGSSKLSERSIQKRKKKTGSHTMQSIGIYAKDDNAKGELVDGGGGTLYEQDVTDDEDEVSQDQDTEEKINDQNDNIEEVPNSDD